MKGVAVAKAPMIIAGPEKCLKTSIAVDLAVSLATGRPFLGHFEVGRPVRVAVLSGESGEHALQDTFHRVCRARNVDPKGCEILWQFDLPSFVDPADVEAWRTASGRAGSTWSR